MKLLLVLLSVVGFINTAKSQSSEEILSGCKMQWNDLKCLNFQHSHLPYKEEFKAAKFIVMYGNFSELTIDPNYVNVTNVQIESVNLQRFQLQDYAVLPKLVVIFVDKSEQVINVNFTGAEKLADFKNIYFSNNKQLNYSCENFKSSNLPKLQLSSNSIDEFDFNCVPSTMKDLSLYNNNISTFRSFDSLRHLSQLTDLTWIWNSVQINRFNFGWLPISIQRVTLSVTGISEFEGYESLRNLSSLGYLNLKANNITDFNIGYIPPSLYQLVLDGNNITEISLSAVPPSHMFQLSIHGNPIQCTCSLVRDYVQTLESGYVTFLADWITGQPLKCANNDSKLADYPWKTDAAAIKLHDASALCCFDCLTEEETDLNDVFRRIVSQIFTFFARFF